jgi:hypothetical protein
VSTAKITSSLRIAAAVGDIPSDVQKALLSKGGFPSLGDRSIWTIDVDLGDLVLFEEGLAASLRAVQELRSTPSWPTDLNLSVWMTVSTTGEFAGLVVSAEQSALASTLKAALVFSVYCHQVDD